MQTTTGPTPSPWRAWRETLGLTMNEVGRRAGINSGRLSVIERGVAPSKAEADKLWAVLIEATSAKEATA